MEETEVGVSGGVETVYTKYEKKEKELPVA